MDVFSFIRSWQQERRKKKEKGERRRTSSEGWPGEMLPKKKGGGVLAWCVDLNGWSGKEQLPGDRKRTENW